MIDPKQYSQIQRDIARYGLARIDPMLPILLSKMRPGSEQPLDLATWPHVLARYERLIQGIDLTGTLTVPAPVLPNGFPVGVQTGTESIVSLSTLANSLIAGPNGVGKTTLLQWALLSAYRAGYKLFLPDPKNDSAFWLALDPAFVRIDAQTAWNPLAKPPWRTLDAHITEQVELFKRHFFGGEAQGAVARQAFTRAYSDHPNACGADVHAQIEKLNTKTQTYSWRDACLWASERWHKIRQRYPVAYHTRNGSNLSTLLNQHLYLDIMTMDPVGEWITSILLNHIFQRNKANGTRGITTVAALDEALSSASASHAATNITGTNPIVTIATMNREYGLRLLFSTADLDATDRILINTVSTIALLPGIRDTNSLRRLGLTPAQMNTVARLPIGQAMLLYPGQLTWPVITTFPPLPDGLKERRPPPAPQQTTTVAASIAAPGPAPEGTPDKIGLTIIEERLLLSIADVGPCLVSHAYRHAKLRPMEGDRARKKLEHTLGLITSARVLTGQGRGKSGIALTLTNNGWERLRRQRPHGNRGGSGLQHEYWCHQIAHALGAREVMIGTKSVDVLMRYTAARHEPFWGALTTQALTLTTIEQPNEGALIAIEIETSTDTATNNILKNLAVGVPHTITATRDTTKARRELERHVPADQWPRVLIVDLLWLLDHCRSEEP